MPTLGNVFQFSDKDAQAIGNWIEQPQGGGGINRPRAVVTMGIHYSGQRTLASAQVKIRLLDRLFELWERQKDSCAMTEQGLLEVDAWTWPGLQAMHLQYPWEPQRPPPDGQPL